MPTLDLALPSAGGVVNLLEWNRSLACENWACNRLARLVDRNPGEIVFRTSEGTVAVRSNEIYQHRELMKIPGIDPKRVQELYEVELLAAQACKTYFYDGRRIIALFCGNLKALDRMESLLRNGEA